MGFGEGLYGRYPPGWAVVSANSAATHEIVAAVTGKRILVLGATLKVANGQTLTWVRGTSTAMSGAMVFATSDLLYTASNPLGLFATGVGERLALTLGAATQVSGHVTYALVD